MKVKIANLLSEVGLLIAGNLPGSSTAKAMKRICTVGRPRQVSEIMKNSGYSLMLDRAAVRCVLLHSMQNKNKVSD